MSGPSQPQLADLAFDPGPDPGLDDLMAAAEPPPESPGADVDLDGLIDRIQNDDYTPDPLTIAGLDKADRALARLRRLDAHMAEVTELYQARLAEIQEWLEAEQRRDAHARAWLEAGLRQFHETVLLVNPRAKTISLPSGDLTARQLPARWEYPNEPAFIEWAEERRADLLAFPDPKVVRNAVKAAALKVEDDGRVIDPDSGEVVPGVRVVKGETRFTVVPKAGPVPGGAR